MENRMIIFLLLCTLVLGVFCARTVDVQSGESVTVPCDLAGTFQYPTWSGPGGLANPLNNGQQINEKGIQWANNVKDLMISNASTRYLGDYTCSFGGNSASVNLNVLYFEAPNVFYNRYLRHFVPLVLVCSVYSNPNSSLSWILSPEFNRITEKTPTVCGIDKTINKVKCESTLRFPVDYISEEYNGNTTCLIDYPNRPTKIFTVLNVSNPLASSVRLIDGWKPITVAGNVELTCSIYDDRVMKWFRGKNDTDMNRNQAITTANKAISEDPRLFIEKLMLNVTNSMNGEKIYCCAVDTNPNNTALCSSRLISVPTSSSTGVSIGVSSSKLLLFWSFLLMALFRQ